MGSVMTPDDWITLLAPMDGWNERLLMATFALTGLPPTYLDVGSGTGAMVNFARRLIERDVKAAAGARVPIDKRLRLEYLEIVDPEMMQPVESIERPVLVAGALWVGSTRLIDNLLCTPLRRPTA